MNKQVTTERVASIPLFADVPPAKLADIAAVGRVFTAPTGHVLAEEGDFSSSFFILLDDCVRGFRPSPDDV